MTDPSASDSTTDLVIIRGPSGSSTSSAKAARAFGVPSGTFSSGVDLTLGPGGSVIEVKASSSIADVTEGAREFLSSHGTRRQAAQAMQALREIEGVLNGYEHLDLPMIRIHGERDGSIGLSWRFNDALFGVAIRRSSKESSWFLVQGDSATGLRADGSLTEVFYQKQLPALFELLIRAQS
jgi:hypothetical protein